MNTLETIKAGIDQMMADNAESFFPKNNQIPLNTPVYDSDEVMEVIDCLVSSNVTMGKKTKRFEHLFAEKMGKKHAIMVNSGSSANLLVAFALANKQYSNHLLQGDEIIFPALTWPTTIFPFVQAGFKPVLVDVESDTFNISPERISQAITNRTKAVCIVPILGNPCSMSEIRKICEEKGLVLIEDTCEALGSKVQNMYCGTFGIAGTFSFYFSHHITTVEGGMVVTDDDELYDIMLQLRSHGWTRHLPDPHKVNSRYPDIDSRFLFTNLGFNLRPTDIQAAFGIHQIKKLDSFNEKRRNSAKLLLSKLAHLQERIQLPVEREGTFHTWFGFPFLLKPGHLSRQMVINRLEEKNIATRPIVGGNLSIQPAFSLFDFSCSGTLDNVKKIHEFGIYIGLHPNTTVEQIEYISSVFETIFSHNK